MNYANEVLKTLQKKFNIDIPIIEAVSPLRLMPKPCDEEGAEPKNPLNCLLVHTAQRMFDALAVVVWKTTVYVLLLAVGRGPGVRLPGHAGRWRWERYVIREGALKILASFDRGEPFEEGTSIIFESPTFAHTRATKRKLGKKYRATESGKLAHKTSQARRTLKHAKAAMKKLPPSANPSARAQARAHIKKLETEFAKASRKQEEVAGSLGKRISKAPTFDLTTRNGAQGKYHFVRQDQRPGT
jgi:hypothetical protein